MIFHKFKRSYESSLSGAVKFQSLCGQYLYPVDGPFGVRSNKKVTCKRCLRIMQKGK